MNYFKSRHNVFLRAVSLAAALSFLSPNTVFVHPNNLSERSTLAPSSKMNDDEYIAYQSRLAAEEIRKLGKRSFSPEEIPEIQKKFPADVVWCYKQDGFEFTVRGRVFTGWYVGGKLYVARGQHTISRRARAAMVALSSFVPGRLRAARKAKRLVQIELGNMVGESGVTISLLETGAKQPDAELVRKLAAALDVPESYLEGKTDMELPQSKTALVPERLKIARKMRGYSLRELGALVGVSRQTMLNLESGVNYPRDKDMVRKLAKALNVTQAFLVGISDTEIVGKPLVADRLLAARAVKGLSREYLSGVVDVSVYTVKKWETGATPLYDSVIIRKLAETLEVPYEYLTGEKDVALTGNPLIPERLRAARKARSLSQPALGRLTGVATQTILRWETGKIAVKDANKIAVMAEALGVPYEYLTGKIDIDFETGEPLVVAADIVAEGVSEEKTKPPVTAAVTSVIRKGKGKPIPIIMVADDVGTKRRAASADADDGAERKAAVLRENAREKLRMLKALRKLPPTEWMLDDFVIRMSLMMGTDLERTYLSVSRNPLFTGRLYYLMGFFQREIPRIIADTEKMSDREFDAYCVTLFLNAWLIFDYSKFLREAHVKQPVDPVVMETLLSYDDIHQDPMEGLPPAEVVLAFDAALEEGLPPEVMSKFVKPNIMRRSVDPEVEQMPIVGESS